MTRLSLTVVVVVFVGGVIASVISGCSKAAERTLTIYQLQSTKTYDGHFHLDTSQLPADAIEELVDTGGPGDPVRQITLKTNYEFEVVLRLKGGSIGSNSHSSGN